MCFEPSTRPPEPPRTGLLDRSEHLTLTAPDGNALAATVALTTRERAPGVVVLPDIRGLHPYYEALAQAFAGAGVTLSRSTSTAGRPARSTAARTSSGGPTAPLRGTRRSPSTSRPPARSSDAAVRAGSTCSASASAAGLHSCRAQPGLAGVIGFYGAPTRTEDDGSSPLEEARAGRLVAPVLALYGGTDENITAEHARTFAEALDARGIPQESVIYDGAPHSFFDRAMSDHEEACADAWRLVLRFMAVPAD